MVFDKTSKCDNIYLIKLCHLQQTSAPQQYTPIPVGTLKIAKYSQFKNTTQNNLSQYRTTRHSAMQYNTVHSKNKIQLPPALMPSTIF
jgi:hypothetical protein